MGLERLTIEEAAKLSGEDVRTLKRKIAKGIIRGEKESLNRKQFKYTINKSEFKYYQKCEKAFEELSGKIKEIYILFACGYTAQELSKLHKKSEIKIVRALQAYNHRRAAVLNSRGVLRKKFDKFLLVEEITARLGISDYNIIYSLIKEDRLESRENHLRKKVITLESFLKYLGNDKKTKFYKSTEVATHLRMTVNRIDKIALKNNIGRKINGGKQSNYLFKEENIRELRQYR